MYGVTAQSNGYGVEGFNSNANGTGVMGVGNNVTGSYLTLGSGVAGSSNNVGVYGYGNNTSGSTGVYGISINTAGDGVFGINDAAASTGAGTGVYGISSQSGSGSAGVMGVNDNNIGNGMIGIGSNSTTYYTSGYGDGVAGTTDNSLAYGVKGTYFDGSDGDISGYLGSSSYGAFGQYLNGRYGYLGGSTRAVEGAYSTTGPWGFIGDSDKGIYGNWGSNGNWAGYFVGNLYAYNIYGDNFYLYDTYDDLELLNSIDAKIVWDPILNHHVMTIIPETMPECVTNYEERKNGKSDEILVSFGKMDGLLIGSIRQMDKETDVRDNRLVARTDILANMQGLDFSNINSGSVLINVSDFGSSAIDGNKIIVEFNSDFVTKLNGAIPIITVTSNSPGIILYVAEKTSESFTVETNIRDANCSFDWIAMAKVEMKIPSTTDCDHIDDVFYRDSFDVAPEQYDTINYEKDRQEKYLKSKEKRAENSTINSSQNRTVNKLKSSAEVKGVAKSEEKLENSSDRE